MKTIKTLKTTLSALAVAAGLAASAGAQATITTYSSASAFDAAMTGLTTTNYATYVAPSGYSMRYSGGGTTSYNYGTAPIAFNGGSFIFGNGYDWNNVAMFGGASYNVYGASNFVANWYGTGNDTINFSSPIYGFALNGGGLGAPAPGGQQAAETLGFAFGGATATIALPNALTYVNSGTGQWTSTGQPLTYMAFSSDTPFTSVSITDPFGTFSTQSITIATGAAQTVSATSTVPEPGSIALLMLGSLGIVRVCKKPKKQMLRINS
jgi:hypothetical protein